MPPPLLNVAGITGGYIMETKDVTDIPIVSIVIICWLQIKDLRYGIPLAWVVSMDTKDMIAPQVSEMHRAPAYVEEG